MKTVLEFGADESDAAVLAMRSLDLYLVLLDFDSH